MAWASGLSKGEVTFAEIAPAIDYAKLERDLINTARMGNWSLATGTVLIIVLFGIAFAFNLSGDSFSIVMVLAAVVLPAILVGLSIPLSMRARRVEALNAIIHEEWKSGRTILPEGFRIPRGFRKLRIVPEMTESLVRRLKMANLAISDLFGVAASLLVFVGFLFGIYLVLNRAPLWLFFGIMVAPALPILVFMIAMWPVTNLLRELQEYEEVTGRTILPPGLSEKKGKTRLLFFHGGK